MMTLNQTALTGVRVRLLTRLIQKEAGKQSSRAYAKVTLDAATWAIHQHDYGIFART